MVFSTISYLPSYRVSDASATKIAAISVHYHNIKGGCGMAPSKLLKSIYLESITSILYIVYSTHTTILKWEAAPTGKMANGWDR
jgi:hypothetical protein